MSFRNLQFFVFNCGVYIRQDGRCGNPACLRATEHLPTLIVGVKKKQQKGYKSGVLLHC